MIECRKVPIILISGFLGSGKTSLIAELLDGLFVGSRVAVVQNEFAASSIDSTILKQEGRDFVLRELNTGSIFCTCLFSHFRDAVVELAELPSLDSIIVEATGIADPIGIAKLLEEESVAKRCYLSQIITLVDATRFLRGVSQITGARHQVQVADVVVVSKTDLVDAAALAKVRERVVQINPMAQIVERGRGAMELQTLMLKSAEPQSLKKENRGELTSCGEGGYVSKIFKSARAIKRSNLDCFLSSLTDDILRLKGYVVTDDAKVLMVQYTPGYLSVKEVDREIVGNTELIAIGYREPQFVLLQIDCNIKLKL